MHLEEKNSAAEEGGEAEGRTETGGSGNTRVVSGVSTGASVATGRAVVVDRAALASDNSTRNSGLLDGGGELSVTIESAGGCSIGAKGGQVSKQLS